MIRLTVYGQLMIILVYVPPLTFTGVEGRTFERMALTVIIALVYGLSLLPEPHRRRTCLERRSSTRRNRTILKGNRNVLRCSTPARD